MVSLTEISHDDGVRTVQIGDFGCGEAIHNGERIVECSVTESEVMDIHIRFSDGEIVEIVTKANHVEDAESVESDVEVQTVMEDVDDEQPFVEDEVIEDPAIDLTWLDIDIQFESFAHATEPPEPLYIAKNVTCEGVDDIDDGQGDGQRVRVPNNVQTYSLLVKLNEQIKTAQLQLDEKIRCKDAIAAQMGIKWENMVVHNKALNAKNLELRAARQLVESKRQQIEHVERVINKVKNAFEVKGIHSMKNKTEHMGSLDEIQHALAKKDQIEEHLEDLKNELKILKDDVSKTEEACDTITKKYIEEHDMERELRARFIAAGGSCKEASEKLNSLKKCLYDKEAKFLDEWNSSEEFRKDYISKCNMLATPNTQDEPSRVFTDDTDQKVVSNSSLTLDEITTTLAVTNLETQKAVKSVNEKHLDDQVKENVLEEFEHMMKNKESIKPDELTDIKEKEKTNELIKEKTRLEEKVKAKETDERAKTWGEIQAQKKEKARLKRLRKREKKRAGRDAASSSIVDGDVVGSNASKEIESTNGKSQQHPSPPNFLSKQLKPKFIPPPPAVVVAIRNKQRRRLWGNMVITVMVMILCVFLF
ncbi:hypothetical protein L1987_76200 [Smallanthus sonchifolius]|uniref:Uncharacterized protein n=1 Tax=Smallanthus sonchifolius TaxID=185202 RepID=A0ACB9A7I6_9ASTR|nr:hypothetical protein L1987_76200 [Smallanthus sonchifolius]